MRKRYRESEIEIIRKREIESEREVKKIEERAKMCR